MYDISYLRESKWRHIVVSIVSLAEAA